MIIKEYTQGRIDQVMIKISLTTGNCFYLKLAEGKTNCDLLEMFETQILDFFIRSINAVGINNAQGLVEGLSLNLKNHEFSDIPLIDVEFKEEVDRLFLTALTIVSPLTFFNRISKYFRIVWP